MLWSGPPRPHGSVRRHHTRVAIAYDSAEPSACYRVGPMVRSPFEDLVHRVNNLLGTIEIQVEVAQAEGTLAAHAAALATIADSARRTHAELRILRNVHRRDHDAGGGPESSGSIEPSF